VGGGIVGPLFHFIIFHILSALVKLNVTARMASNTLGLQSDLHKFDDILKEKRENLFFPNVCTCANLPHKQGKLV